MAIERANNGNVPVDALLAALRRAAEDDGVDDVDAVVAEFATFVRAQAPQLASAAPVRRQGSGWTTAVLAAGALTTAAFGAVASGLVANPLIDTGPSGSTNSSDVVVEAAPATTVDLDAPAPGSGTRPGATGPATAIDPAPPSDPDALALTEAQQSAAADGTDPTTATGPTTPTAPTTPTGPPGPAAPASADAAAASTTSTTTTIPDDGDADGSSEGDGPDGPDVVEPLGATPQVVGSPEEPLASSEPLEPLEPLDMPFTTPSATVASLDDQGGVG